MKRILLIIAVLFAASPLSANEKANISSLWDQANTYYINGDFSSAIVLYDSILNEGYAGSKLYYNLGNAHFKSDQIGKAIVNYNKAQKLAPYDKDIEYNLAVANSYIKDRIDAVPQFFLSNWFSRLRAGLSSNVWAVISLAFFAAALTCTLVYMLAQKKSARKGGFFSAIILFVFFIVTVSFASKERRELLNATEAIVIAPAASVKSSPDRNSKDLFIIHEGTKVSMSAGFNGWTEITLSDGNKGWILDEALERIDLRESSRSLDAAQ